MLKTVLNRLMEECKNEIKKLKEEELNEETVMTYNFLNRQYNYMKNLQDRLKEEETKENE